MRSALADGGVNSRNVNQSRQGPIHHHHQHHHHHHQQLHQQQQQQQPHYQQHQLQHQQLPTTASFESMNGNNFGGSASYPVVNPPPPPPGPELKEWQKAIGPELRSHLVGKLVKTIFPAPDPAAMHDQRIKDLISYARKVEREMFEVARDKEQYYHLLAERIYKIQKELEERKSQRFQRNGILHQRFMHLPHIMSTPFHLLQELHLQQLQNMPPVESQEVTKPEPVEVEPMPLIDAATNIEIAPIVPKVAPVVANDAPVVMDTPPVCVKQETPMLSVAMPEPPKPDAMEVDPPKPEQGSSVIFDYDELRADLLYVWRAVDSAAEAHMFRMPVDCESLQIHDYYDIIKTPMDLNTIREKLDTWQYTNPRQFCADMWQIFENAWIYNRKVTKVYKMCTRLSEIFVEYMDPMMEKLGYCCSQKRTFTPLALFCFGQSMCTIARDQAYYMYEASSNGYGVNVSEKYIYCVKCFEALPDAGLNLNENPSDPPNYVPKNKFSLLKNNEVDEEPFEKCKLCSREWHTICANFNKKVFHEGFVCLTCRTEKNLPKPENNFTAKKLPHCHLSRFIEDHVNNFITNALAEKNLTDSCEVVIRVLSCIDKDVEVKPLMKTNYGAKGYPEKFPYRTKAIFAFQVIDGVEICFFGLHVQEYGSECPKPNSRRVYIAYVDSVFYFQPRQIRTDVYHEILLAYLSYARNLGYVMAHIWACPPSEGDDYIFHCHPPEQKIPKPKRLQDWYKTMLDKGINGNIVVEYKDILKQARDDGMSTPMTLPYFEGDFWPNIIEDCIRDAEKEENRRKVTEGDDDDEDGDGGDDRSKGARPKVKSAKKKSNSKSKNKKAVCGAVDKLYNCLDKHKETFFTIRLISVADELTVVQKKIEDPDSLISSDLMDGRDNFLSRARDEHWEFSSFRRTRYSTLCLCLALHTSEDKDVSYTCNRCQSGANWHCATCEDFDLCETCKQATGHDHKLEKISQLVEMDKSASASSSDRHENLQRCVEDLKHACQCRDANCRRSSCHRMKKVVGHMRICKKRHYAPCQICKQFAYLCMMHAKNCTLTTCLVPLCLKIRQRLREQRRLQNRRADKMMRRRMEHLHTGDSATVAPTPTASPPPPPPSSTSEPLPSPSSASASSTTMMGAKHMPVTPSPMESNPFLSGKPAASPAFGEYSSAPNSVPRNLGSVPQPPSHLGHPSQPQTPEELGQQMMSPRNMATQQQWQMGQQAVRPSLAQQPSSVPMHHSMQYPQVPSMHGATNLDSQHSNSQLRKQLVQQSQQNQYMSQHSLPTTPSSLPSSLPSSVPSQRSQQSAPMMPPPPPYQQHMASHPSVSQQQAMTAQQQSQMHQMQQQQQHYQQMHAAQANRSQQQLLAQQHLQQQHQMRPQIQLRQQLQQRLQQQHSMNMSQQQQMAATAAAQQQYRMISRQPGPDVQHQMYMDAQGYGQHAYPGQQQQQLMAQQQQQQQQQYPRAQPPPYGMMPQQMTPQQYAQMQQQQQAAAAAQGMWSQGGQSMQTPQQQAFNQRALPPGDVARCSSMMSNAMPSEPSNPCASSSSSSSMARTYGEMSKQVDYVCEKLRCLKTPEEKTMLMHEIKKNPPLFTAVMKVYRFNFPDHNDFSSN